MSLIADYLIKALPAASTLHSALLEDRSGTILDHVLKFDSAKAALCNMDISSDPSANLQSIREVVLQARASHRCKANEQPRFDCVACVDRNGNFPQIPFRAETLKFFHIRAAKIVDVHGKQFSNDDLVFVLVGAFRTMPHAPFANTVHRFTDGVVRSRAALLGTTLVKLPPDHITVFEPKWESQRFSVISLRDILSTIHVIPLTRPDGTPFLARFHAEGSMSNVFPALAKHKQLHLLNTNIYI